MAIISSDAMTSMNEFKAKVNHILRVIERALFYYWQYCRQWTEHAVTVIKSRLATCPDFTLTCLKLSEVLDLP